MDPQFPWWILSNAIGSFAAGLAVTMVCLASKKLCSAIVRRCTSRLPQGQDAARAREELEGIVQELRAAERAELAAHLLLRSGELRREIADRAAERAAITRGVESAPKRAHREIKDNISVSQLLKSLRQIDARAAEGAEARFCGELTEEQIASLLGRDISAVGRDWFFASQWLAEHMTDPLTNNPRKRP